jgi:hypothetical protein
MRRTASDPLSSCAAGDFNFRYQVRRKSTVLLYPVLETTLVLTEIVRNRVSKLAIYLSSSSGLPMQAHGRHDLGTELPTASWSYQAQPHYASWLSSLTFHAACVAAAPSAPKEVKTALSNLRSSILYSSRRFGLAPKCEACPSYAMLSVSVAVPGAPANPLYASLWKRPPLV